MDRVTGRPFASRSEVLAPGALVATSQPLATQAGLDAMRRGGSAVDAAITANAVLGLVEPTGCGLGGDLFALVWSAGDRRLHGLNASGRSPRELTLEDLHARGLQRLPALGPLSVSVPGCVDGWWELHQRFGRLPWPDLFRPAIEYARGGFPVTEVIAAHWAASARRLGEFAGFAEVFLPGGRAPREGERFRNPHLARTLEELAEGGRDAFYLGRPAESIERYLREQEGHLRAADLAAHRSEWVEPISTSYRGVELWELPPNTQGFSALQILNLLEPYDVAGWGFGSPDHVHHFVEAKRLAFEDRARYCADPEFAALPVEELISKAYAERRRSGIDPVRAARHVGTGCSVLEGGGDTVYLCAADEERNLVSLIQSNFRGMGSGMTPPELGFVLQNRGELFDLAPGRPNTYAPGKRPFHTIIPAFLTRGGAPWAAFGVMGGATQPQAHAWVVMNLVDFGMNFQEAGDAPRVVHEGSSSPTGEEGGGVGRLFLESRIGQETVRELHRRGHRPAWSLDAFGGYQAVALEAEADVLHGASESRKDGHAAGY